MRFISGLEEIVSLYNDFIVDLWGVVHDGYTLYPEVLTTLNALKKQGKRVIFLSNAPRRALPIIKQLEQLGVPRNTYFDLHSSGEDAYQTLKKDHKDKTCFPFMAAPHSHLLEDIQTKTTYVLEEADFILNTGPEHMVLEEHQEVLQKAKKLSLPMMCVNPDISVISKGQHILCAGALARRYEEMGGIVTYHGKPHPQVYHTLWKKLGKPDKRHLCAIGDSLNTDILGANIFGIHSLLVMTGLEGMALQSPENAFPNMEKLHALCQHKKATPTYVSAALKYS